MATVQHLASELRNVMQDLSGLQANVQRISRSLSRNAETAVDHIRGPVEVTRRNAHALMAESDRLVRRNPWAFAAGALLVGLAFSLLCTTRKR